MVQNILMKVFFPKSMRFRPVLKALCVCVHVYMFSKGKVFDNEQQMKVERRRNKTNVNSIRHKIRWGLKGRAVYSEKSVRQEL